MKNLKIALISSACLLLIGIAGTAILDFREPPPLEFSDLKGIPIMSPAIPLPVVNLIDHNGNIFTTDNLKGKWSLLFFGYTHCPDVCPTTLASLNRATKKLADRTPQIFFITLDPKRDSMEKIKDYVTHFNPYFIGLSGTKPEIDKLSDSLGVIYDYEGDIEKGDYVVNHYAAILVIDPKARLRAHILPPHQIDRITTAFTSIQDYYGN